MSLATLIPTRLRAFTLAATLAAVAFPAAAASVKVNINGLDAKAAHAQIVHAAATVCSAALADQPLRYYAVTACIDQTVSATEAKFAANDHRYAVLPANGR